MDASAQPVNGPLDNIYGGSLTVQPHRNRPYIDQIRFESYDGRAVLIEVGPFPADDSY